MRYTVKYQIKAKDYIIADNSRDAREKFYNKIRVKLSEEIDPNDSVITIENLEEYIS